MFTAKNTKAGRVAAGAVATLLAAAGLGAATAGPASANPRNCQANAICLAENRNFQGLWLYVTLDQSVPSNFCYNMPADFNDRASSVVNTSGRTVVVYRHGNCQEAVLTVPPGGQFLDLGEIDNVTSSIRI